MERAGMTWETCSKSVHQLGAAATAAVDAQEDSYGILDELVDARLRVRSLSDQPFCRRGVLQTAEDASSGGAGGAVVGRWRESSWGCCGLLKTIERSKDAR